MPDGINNGETRAVPGNGEQKPQIVDRIELDEVYANYLVNVGESGGSITVTLGVIRAIPLRVADPAPTVIHIVQRLALAPAVVHQLVEVAQRIMSDGSPTQGTPPGRRN